ncbi:hypothetical protein [Streptomyces microflavus]|uniref:Uncharacterized protein n=1 Tax=Streptomyces microflavus TaxID=1919 RepID=A0ABV1QBI8_STRMI
MPRAAKPRAQACTCSTARDGWRFRQRLRRHGGHYGATVEMSRAR